MIIHDAATAFVLLVDTAVRWVQILAAGAAFTLCVAAFAVGPLVAPRARRGAWRGRGAPQTAQRDSRVTGTTPSPSRGRTARPVPSWAHTEPYTYDEAA